VHQNCRPDKLRNILYKARGKVEHNTRKLGGKDEIIIMAVNTS